MKSLKQFYFDTETKENVKNYLIEFLEKEALEKVFAGDEVLGFCEAKRVIEKAFYNLEVLFDTKPQAKEKINEAR